MQLSHLMARNVTTNAFANSSQALSYKLFRPTYPQALLDHIFSNVKNNKLAIDLCCGSGQVTKALSTKFDNVIGIDVSKEQLLNADIYPNVRYQHFDLNETQLNTIVAENSANLVSIGSSLHWFMPQSNMNNLLKNISNIIDPIDGIFVVLSLTTPYFDGKDQALIQTKFEKYFIETLGPYWSCDVRLVNSGLDDINFQPYFKPVEKIKWFEKTCQLNQEQLYGYCQSLSSHQAFCKDNQECDPLESLKQAIEVHLTNNDKNHVNITFPFFLLLLKKN